MLKEDLTSLNQKTNHISFGSSDEFIFQITDKENNILLAIDKQGLLSTLSIELLKESIVDLQQKTNQVFFESNDEYLFLIKDQDGNLLFGIDKNGLISSLSVEMLKEDLTSLNQKTNHISFGSSDEFIFQITDKENNILLAIDKQGLLSTLSIELLKESIVDLQQKTNQVFFESNDEYLFLIKDQDGNIVFSIDKNSNIWYNNNLSYLENIVKELNKITHYSNISDNDDWMTALLDIEQNLLSYRKTDGTLVEKKVESQDLETQRLKVWQGLDFENTALNELQKDLLETGVNFGRNNKSEQKDMLFPFPKQISFLNVDLTPGELPSFKPTETNVKYEFWDQNGNYFKRDGVISVQGDSTQFNLRKGFTLDLKSGSLQFGTMPAKDSYYLKSYYTDAFRGQSIVAYRLYMDVINTRPFDKRFDFYGDYKAPKITTGTGTMLHDMSSGAKYVADGFPVAFYWKGKFYGVYCVVQKKDRANYDFKKSSAKQVWLDGFFHADFFGGNIDWTKFEIRNPSLKNMDGSDYNGDFPQEPQASTTKTYIVNLSNRMAEINAQTTVAGKKAKFEQYFSLQGLMDYFIFSNIIFNVDGFAKNWLWYTRDGVKWSIGVHDMDSIFGMYWRGNCVPQNQINNVIGFDGATPMIYLGLYANELKTRTAELVNGVLSSDKIAGKLKEWLDTITYDFLKKDLEKWPETPSYRPSLIQASWELYQSDAVDSAVPVWNSTTNYAIGDLVKINDGDVYIFKAITTNTNKYPITGSYQNDPKYLGFYNSIDRVRQFVEYRKTIFNNWLNTL